MRLGLFLTLFFLASLGYSQEKKVFVFLNSKPDKEEISEEATAELMKLHLANIEQMAKDGKLLVAGPFDGGGGIFIFNTDDPAVTREWLSTDPAVRANRWDIEIFPLTYDKGGACLAQEPYEMVTYNFLRVRYINDIANYKMNNSAIEGFAEAVKHDSTIAVGRFPQYDGGYVLTKGEAATMQSLFSPDQTSLELKKLWVAKGSFCETN